MTQKRILIFVLISLFIALGGYSLIQLAKGYRFDMTQKSFLPSGLLVATSTPDGAQIFVDGELKSATNTTIYLAPGTYKVELKKDGFRPWQKTLKVDKEMVSRTDAWLFPIVPDFQASTYTGASNPSLSPNNSKIIYIVDGDLPEKDGIWVLELSSMPFVSQEPRQILKSLPHNRDLSKVSFNWSPDSRQVLVAVPFGKIEENYLLDSTVLNSPASLVDMTPNLQIIQKQWATEKQIKQDQKMAKLPKTLAQLFIENANQIVFSPDETKVLYTAAKETTIPDGLIPPVPSFSNQPQDRQLKQNQNYVYDIKEDRNYLIKGNNQCVTSFDLPVPTPTPVKGKSQSKTEVPGCILTWFPTSRHVLFIEKDKISLVEFEGTNPTTIFEGSYQYPFAFPHPSSNRIMILTSLTNGQDSVPNLYSVSLR